MATDKYHGVGGSYILDSKTGERRQVEKPTAPSPEGGARDKDGKLLNKAHDVVEPAFAVPAGAEKPVPQESAALDSAGDAGKSSRKGA